MSLAEIERAVAGLHAEEFADFARWFEQLASERWDRSFEADVAAGRLDEPGRKAQADFENGRCREL